MQASIIAALLSSAASLIVALISLVSSRIQGNKQAAIIEQQHENNKDIETFRYELERHQTEEKRGSRAKAVLDHYRGPLLDAAWDLGHRVDGIRAFQYMSKHGAPEGRRHEIVVFSTLFRISQYLAWREILRRKIQFLNYEAPEDTRRTFQILERITRVLASDDLEDLFLLDREPQRAIGECMIKDDGDGETCIGYAEFCNAYDERFSRWLRFLAEDLTRPGIEENRRLAMLHTALAQLVDKLDDEVRYIPGWRIRSPGVELPPPR